MEAAQTSWRSLGELFVERGLISEADLERALAEQVATKRRLADILVRRGLVTGHDITSALMEQLGTAAPTPVPARPKVVAAAPPPTPAPAPAPAPGQQAAEIVALPEPPRPAVAPATEPEPMSAAEEKPVQNVAQLPSDAPISAHVLITEAGARRRGAEIELNAARNAHAHMLRGLEQVRAELEARDLSTESLANELEQTKARLRAREDELAKQVESWDDARREVERCGTQLAELQTRLEAKENELSEATASATAWAVRASQLDAESEALAGRVDALLRTLETLAVTRFSSGGADLGQHDGPANGPVHKGAAQPGPLYFVPKAEGYDLFEREGEVPAIGEVLEFDGDEFLVTKIGRSPLPFDRRSCVFLTVV